MNFAIIGKNIKNSLSPRMHKWIYNSLGLDHYYKAIDINLNNVDNIVNKLKEGALNGINVTIPFKRDFTDYLDGLDEISTYIGAINCIHSHNGLLRGYNTDYYGFKRLLSCNNIELNDKEILVLGAGGASRAICGYLANNNLSFSIFNRTHSNALSIIEQIDYNEKVNIVSNAISNIDYDIIINCLPLSVDIFEQLQSIGYNFKLLDYYLDINYHINTQIDNRIKAQVAIDGLDMLIYQGIQSNEIWLQKSLEQKIDCHKLRNHLLES